MSFTQGLPFSPSIQQMREAVKTIRMAAGERVNVEYRTRRRLHVFGSYPDEELLCVGRGIHDPPEVAERGFSSYERCGEDDLGHDLQVEVGRSGG
jgi:hypothetical protein